MRFISIAVIAAVLVTVMGCRSAENGSDGEKAEKLPVVEPVGDSAVAKMLAQNYIDAFAKGMQSGDYAKFEPMIPEASRKTVNRETFDRTVEQYRKYFGELKSIEYVCELEKPLVRDFVWKFSFEKKSSKPGHDDEVARRDILYMVRVGQIDGKPVLAGSGVMNGR
ncbi:MAG: hypothetical protein PHI35_03245 [Victivallaceae bacterium]|nr:hypothetical protein [Victivallaceae bacterium]